MLAPYAVRVEDSRGRRYPEPPHPYRNPFQRDRDRIIHARAFRRLENKTQVFTRRYSDHFRTRLTHTMEVAQISRTIAAELSLNVDLVEALALTGVAVGVAAALLLTRLMPSLLFGVTAGDPLTFCAVPLLLLFIALLATGIPARRAAHVDPAECLRYD